MKKRCAIGVDFGGSHASAAGVDQAGRIIARIRRVKIDPNKPAKEIAGWIEGAIREAWQDALCREYKVIGAGVGSPGPMDKTGKILNTPNLPSLRHFALRAELEKNLGMKVILDNDANVAAAGEAFGGVAKPPKNHRGDWIVYGCTLGTGFGHGLVINGRIHRGAHFQAMEHAVTPYDAKHTSTIEDHVSGRGISKRYRVISGGLIASAEIIATQAEGLGSAVLTYHEFGQNLAFALSWIINCVDPNVVVLGGSIAHAYKLFAPAMKENLRINQLTAKSLKIVPTRLFEKAPIIGAASLVWNN